MLRTKPCSTVALTRYAELRVAASSQLLARLSGASVCRRSASSSEQSSDRSRPQSASSALAVKPVKLPPLGSFKGDLPSEEIELAHEKRDKAKRVIFKFAKSVPMDEPIPDELQKRVNEILQGRARSAVMWFPLSGLFYSRVSCHFRFRCVCCRPRLPAQARSGCATFDPTTALLLCRFASLPVLNHALTHFHVTHAACAENRPHVWHLANRLPMEFCILRRVLIEVGPRASLALARPLMPPIPVYATHGFFS